MGSVSSKFVVVLGLIAIFVSGVLSVYFFFPQIFDRFFSRTGVESQAEGVSVRLIDSESFSQLVESTGVLNKTDSNNVHIVLVEGEQRYDYFGLRDGTVIQSSSYEKVDDTLVIRVFLHPQYVIQERDEEMIADSFLYAAMFRMIKITKNEAELSEEEIRSSIIPYIDGQNEIISIEK